MIRAKSRALLGGNPAQLDLALPRPKRRRKRKQHGGRRRNAGRKRAAANRTLPSHFDYQPHLPRPAVNARTPQHVTIRVVDDIAYLRRMDMYAAVRRALVVVGRNHARFRVVHYSVQGNHLHLLVEADDKAALAAGMKGLEVSLARRINAVMTWKRRARRTGRVFADRYHARPVTSVRGTRNALAYVLNNWRRHGAESPRLADGKVDFYSSGILFPGWKEKTVPEVHLPEGMERPPVCSPTSWLLREGYKLAPPISCFEAPGARERGAQD